MTLAEVESLPRSEYELYRWYLAIFPPVGQRLDDGFAHVCAANGHKYPHYNRADHPLLKQPLTAEQLTAKINASMQMLGGNRT